MRELLIIAKWFRETKYVQRITAIVVIALINSYNKYQRFRLMPRSTSYRLVNFVVDLNLG